MRSLDTGRMVACALPAIAVTGRIAGPIWRCVVHHTPISEMLQSNPKSIRREGKFRCEALRVIASLAVAPHVRTVTPCGRCRPCIIPPLCHSHTLHTAQPLATSRQENIAAKRCSPSLAATAIIIYDDRPSLLGAMGGLRLVAQCWAFILLFTVSYRLPSLCVPYLVATPCCSRREVSGPQCIAFVQ